MNILLITGLYEMKPQSGGSYLMKQYVEALRKAGHTVSLVYFTSNDVPQQQAAEQKDTWYLPLLQEQYLAQRSLLSKVKGKLSGLVSSAPTTDEIEQYFFRDFSWLQGALSRVVDLNKIDVLQVDFPWMMNVVKYLDIKATKVFVSHEAQFVLRKRKGELDKAAQCQLIETKLARKYDVVLTLTPVEAEIWNAADRQLNVQYSPMGIGLPDNTLGVAPKAKKLIFVGSSKHQPNLDGIRFLLNDIWPRVHQAIPDLPLEITGDHAEEFKNEFAGLEGVQFTGFVPSLQEAMKEAISVVPIRLGSGIRVKILEAMAYGTPVVATHLAAEGINVVDGESVLLADEPEGFANHIITLCNNDDAYRAIAVKARKCAEEEYDITETVNRRMRLFETLK